MKKVKEKVRSVMQLHRGPGEEERLGVKVICEERMGEIELLKGMRCVVYKVSSGSPTL